MHIFYDPETWVAIAFLILLAVLAYAGAFNALLGGIDSRRAAIQAELDAARRLKEEAQAVLAAYQQKQREAEQEAAGILEGAKAEAERLAVEAKAKMDEFVARRTKMAEAKIAQAEVQAMADVRAAAADAAVAAAERILSQTVQGSVADRLIDQGIADAKAKLN